MPVLQELKAELAHEHQYLRATMQAVRTASGTTCTEAFGQFRTALAWHRAGESEALRQDPGTGREIARLMAECERAAGDDTAFTAAFEKLTAAVQEHADRVEYQQLIDLGEVLSVEDEAAAVETLRRAVRLAEEAPSEAPYAEQRDRALDALRAALPGAAAPG